MTTNVMYKIGIDARLYSQTGVGVYLQNLLYFLEKMTTYDAQFFIYLVADNYEKIRFKNKNFIKVLADYKWHTVAEQIRFAKSLYRDNLDLVHFTYFSYPVFYKKKFIATIHDITPLSFKTGKASTKSALLYEFKFRAFQFVISQQVKNSKFIITPTKSVKEQLVKIYGESVKNKIKPIYEGIDYELMKLEVGSVKLEKNIKISSYFKHLTSNFKPFIIYVGNFYPHKNLDRLIQAFSKVENEVKLILIGPDDYFSNHLHHLIIKLKQQKRIFFYHNPSKKDLLFFYKNALALVHPSLSEGFGLPILEATYFNLPIIASDIDVFNEILNEKFVKFKADNIDDIKEKIKYFLKSKPRFDYGEMGKKFSFEKMTQQTYHLYHKSLSSQS